MNKEVNKFQKCLDALDPDLANVDKAELGDWAANWYEVIREALLHASLLMVRLENK